MACAALIRPAASNVYWNVPSESSAPLLSLMNGVFPGGAPATVKVAESETFPNMLEHVMVYVYVPAATGVSTVEPTVGCSPAHEPLALQDCKLIPLQESV